MILDKKLGIDIDSANIMLELLKFEIESERLMILSGVLIWKVGDFKC